MPDLLRQALHLAFLLFIISSIWALGWARAITDRLEDHWKPAAEPELFESMQRSEPYRGAKTYTPPPEARELVTSAQDPSN